MSTDPTPVRPSRTRLETTARLIPAASLMLVVGCGDLLTVDNPQEIIDRDLDSPEAVDPLVAGVAGDFAVAYRYVASNMGLYANELLHTGSFPSWRVWEEGVSARPSVEGNGLYNDISRAVWVADDAVERLARVLDAADTRPETAEVLMWGGFARFFFADNFCQATFNGGPPIPPEEIYESAEDRLTQAMDVAASAGADDIELAARGGRARARLMQGDLTGARDDAVDIPEGFAYEVLYSYNSSREYNWMAHYGRDAYRREVGVHPDYYEDDRHISDPRTPFLDRGPDAVGPDEIRQWVEQEKFPARDSPIPLINWEEARLIEAEAELGLGDVERAVDLIDEVRAAAGLSSYDGEMDEESVREQLLYERSAVLWLQGQRFVDLRRTDDAFMEELTDPCVEIGQDEWETNEHLGG